MTPNYAENGPRWRFLDQSREPVEDFLVRVTNHGDRAVRAVEHSVADRTEEQSADPTAATGTDDEQRGVVGAAFLCAGAARIG
jgi:hypothetical protein